jgi:hypothetical protein
MAPLEGVRKTISMRHPFSADNGSSREALKGTPAPAGFSAAPPGVFAALIVRG